MIEEILNMASDGTLWTLSSADINMIYSRETIMINETIELIQNILFGGINLTKR